MRVHGIPNGEYERRIKKLQGHLQQEGLNGAVLFDRAYILYYVGFAFIPTERPIALIVNARGEKVLLVPRLELEHAQGQALVDEVRAYTEYPDLLHPMEVLKAALDDLGVVDPYAADTDGYPSVFGYQGPTLTDVMGVRPRPVGPFVEKQMMVKGAVEIALLKESAKWANLAHRLLQRYTRVGATETEVSLRASAEATLAMLDAIGPVYRSHSLYWNGAHAGYRGQIGRKAAIPHMLAANITFEPGDVLVTGATAPVWGYHAELERTMVIAPVSDEQRRFFNHMLALQDLAISLIRPGMRCADVDKAVRAYYEEHDLRPYWRHHTGHAIGLRYHEGPFLDVGDDTIIRPGMVFTVEPGIYVPDLGGFRHSDTVVVTEDGVEVITYYPRDLTSLTIRGCS